MSAYFQRLTAGLTFMLWSAAALALDLGPTPVPVKILDVAVNVPTTAALDIKTQANTMVVAISATGDLHDLQAKALEIARKLPFPQDGCARKGANLVVDSIDEARIAPSGGTAIITVSGHATAWGCAKVLGAKIKTKIVSDTVTITIPLELYLPAPTQIAFRVQGSVDVKTGNPQTAQAAAAIVGDLNEKLTAAIARSLDSSNARAVIPAIAGLDIHIDEARFAQDQDRLLVKATLQGNATAQALNTLMAMAAHKTAQ